jgi:prevent-host-death family protein
VADWILSAVSAAKLPISPVSLILIEASMWHAGICAGPPHSLDCGYDLTSQETTVEKMSVYDAKAHFSELIERAQSGQATVITKRGRVVAKLVPAKAAEWDRSAVLDEAEAFRKSVRIKGRVNIRKLIEEGRR